MDIKSVEERLNFLSNLCRDKLCTERSKCAQCPIKQEYAELSSQLMLMLPLTVKELNEAKAEEAPTVTAPEIKEKVTKKKRAESTTKWRVTAAMRRLADGMCTKCGKNPIFIKTNGKPSKVCEECAEKARAYQKNVRLKAKKA